MLSTSDIKSYAGRVQLEDVNGNPKGLIVEFAYNAQFVNAWKGIHYRNGFKPHWDGDKKYWRCDLEFIEVIKKELPCFEFSDGVKQWLGLDLEPEKEIEEPKSLDEEIAEMEERKAQEGQEVTADYLISLLPVYRQETGKRVIGKNSEEIVRVVKELADYNPTERDITAPEQWLIDNYPPYRQTLNWDSRTAVIAFECAVALWKAQLRWK